MVTCITCITILVLQQGGINQTNRTKKHVRLLFECMSWLVSFTRLLSADIMLKDLGHSCRDEYACWLRQDRDPLEVLDSLGGMWCLCVVVLVCCGA